MTGDSVVLAVVEAVAAADGLEPAELEPLADYVDPGILVGLSEHDGGPWTFTFRYVDHQVTLTHDGQVLVDGVARKEEVK